MFAGRALGRLAWATALTLLASLPVFVAPTASFAADATLPEASQAQQDALASGERVEVKGERTVRDTVFANPDGETFTLEKSIVPVRVPTAGGGWTTPDATLVQKADGSIGPKAAAVGLSFSAGGAGRDLVEIGSAGRSITMGWSGELPKPRLEGERAVYDDVLPDVNLILTATVEGFRQVLEVETLEAAANPELAALEYGLESEGLRVHEGAAGTLEAVNGNGQVVFRSPSARMWNSAGDATPAGPSAQTAMREPLSVLAKAETDPEPLPAGPLEEIDPLEGPGAGDESAVMDVELTSDKLTVTPDADLIARTTAAELPLYIDPSVELNESERTVLSSDGDTFYNFSGGDNGMSVGRCSSAVIGGYIYYCTQGGAYTNRMYFEMKPDKLKGKHVLDATFAVTETWSFSCDARWVDLERTDPISSSTRWPGPGGPKSDNSWDQMGDRHVSAGRGSACSPSQPRAAIEFNDYAEEPDENLTSTVKAFADGQFSTLTLMLKAKDESDPIAWKRFDDDAVLTVVYVSKPATPTEYGLETGTGQVCSTDASKPTMWSDATPNLAATPQTASGGESGARLRIYFDIDQKNASGTWVDAAQPSTGSEKPSTGAVGDGADQNMTWSELAQNGQYRYRALTLSFYSSDTKRLTSAQTAFCYFTVDSAAPKPPSITFQSTYTACLSGACAPGGAPGRAGTVTFGPAAGSGDTNAAYAYKLSTDSDWRPYKTGATVIETITPVDSGTITLDVRAKDAAGKYGENRIRFLVGEGTTPVGRWTFNETSGKAVDRSAATTTLRDDLTLATGASRAATGRRGVVTEKPVTDGVEGATAVTAEDKSLRLAGTGYAAAAGPVLETQASYTVSAWVRLESTGRNLTAVSQDGAQNSPFYLGYCDAAATWCLRMADADSASTSLDNQRVDAKSPAVLKAWTHLAAVVDTPTKKLTLYVNGVAQGSDTLTSGAWSSSGPLQVGRVKYKGGYVEHFAGDIDEVAVWQEAKPAEMVAREASPEDTNGKSYAELVAQYAPGTAAAGATSLADNSGYGNTLALTSGASLNGEELVLDGANGSAASTRPIVDSLGSFTVATEVSVETKDLAGKADGHRMQVLGQRTATESSWGLWLEKTDTEIEPVLDADENPVLDDNGVPLTRSIPVGRWHFGRLTADGTGVSVNSTELAVLDSPVQLVGAYDARKQMITLYVGGTPQGDQLTFTASASVGETSIGRGWTKSAWGHRLPGQLMDIRLYAGAVTDETHVETLIGY
ncbi:LamG domain-containing protein [Streptomyces sp. NPDC088729]|uniref:LamG domain-containing protein n=1 Tax=Streptomyces sp. NPDC088729 TaxID=3365876 RepID=UPI0037F493FA